MLHSQHTGSETTAAPTALHTYVLWPPHSCCILSPAASLASAEGDTCAKTGGWDISVATAPMSIAAGSILLCSQSCSAHCSRVSGSRHGWKQGDLLHTYGLPVGRGEAKHIPFSPGCSPGTRERGLWLCSRPSHPFQPPHSPLTFFQRLFLPSPMAQHGIAAFRCSAAHR